MNKTFAKQVFLNINIWSKVLSFLFNFKDLPNKTLTLFVSKMINNLDIDDDNDILLNKVIDLIKIPNDYWRTPIDISRICLFISSEFIILYKNNKLFSNIRPKKIPKNPKLYFPNIQTIINDLYVIDSNIFYKFENDILCSDKNLQNIHKSICTEIMILIRLFYMSIQYEFYDKNLTLYKLKNLLEKYLLLNYNKRFNCCITCYNNGLPVTYQYSKNITYTVTLCKKCNNYLNKLINK